MDKSTEEDHHGVQQDIQQIHKVLGENEYLEEEEESDEEEEDSPIREDEAGTSSSGAALSELPGRQQDSQAVPESLSLARPLEPSPENLLQINLSYQDMVCTLLDNIKEARKKNAAVQKSVASKTTSYVRGARPITHFQKHYFSGHPSAIPPLSDEAKEIKAKKIPSPFIQPAKSWNADEDRALYEGVRNDGLQRCMKPLMARQELLYEKRRSAIDDEKHQLTREINDITTRLEHLKAPEEELLGDRMRDIDWLKISSLHLNGERSAIECQLRWQNILHPSINKKAWSKEEETRLDEILENAQGKDWFGVINKLGTNRSPFDCFSNFQHREISQHVLRPFTLEEDEIIMELAERFRVGNRIQFHKVAYFMDQRLARKISARWFKKLNPKSKWGFWTKEEDEALREGIEKYGPKWTKLSQVVKGRQPSQIRDRWLYTLDPNNTKGNYTFKEDLSILQCVKEYGVGTWVATAKKLNETTGITRTPNSVLHRFNSLFRQFFKKAKGISLDESAPMEVLSSMSLNKILDEMIEYRRSLGEKDTAQGSRNWTNLYKHKKRKPRSPPPRILAKNASFITRRNVLSELDKQLTDAVKPIGWALPTPGTWRTFYGSKAVRRQRRHYLFSVLLKALDISIEGNEGLLASMLTNAEGIKILKDNQLIPKATTVTAPDEEGTSVQSEARSSQSEVKPSQSKATLSKKKDKKDKKEKKSGKNGKKKDGASVSEAQQTSTQVHQGQRSQQPCSMLSQGNVPMSQANIMLSQEIVPMSQANITVSQADVPIPSSQHTRPMFAPTRKTVKSELVVQRSDRSVFGEGTLQVGDGYLVPLQNYISSFGDKVPEKKVVTLMHPRVSGVVQPPMQLGGLPILNHQPSPISTPLPLQGTVNIPQPIGFPLAVAPVPFQPASNIPQMVGLPVAMAPGPAHPATNILQPIGLPMARTPLPLQPQQSGIIHVPGKGYLVPLNCIKQEPVAPAPLPVLLPNVISGQGAGFVSGVSERHPAPGSTNSATLTPSSTTASQPVENDVVQVTVEDVDTGMRVSVLEKQSVMSSNHAGQTSVSETTPCSVPPASTSGQSSVSETTPCSVPPASTSGQSSSAQSVGSCEQQESGSFQENRLSPIEADQRVQGDKEVECPQGDAISDPSSITDNRKSVKFDPVLPVLPPNESSIAGLMALLLERKRLEVNAGKRASIKKFKTWSIKSNDKGILRGREGLLQELSSNEMVRGLPHAAGSKSAADEETHSEPVQGDPTDHPEATVEVAKDNNKTGEGKWERRVPVPVGASKKPCKNGYWVTTRSRAEHAEALSSIRKSEWYQTLHPRFLSMFLWPALLSIVGPHRKRVLGPKKAKKTNLAKQTENQPSGSKPVNPTDGDDEAGNTPEGTPKKRKQKQDGRRKYKTPVQKPPKQTEGRETQKLKPSARWKDAAKDMDGVARRTRSASQKKNVTTPDDQGQRNCKVDYVDVSSDTESEAEDHDIEAPSHDGKEAHPQAFMAFGYTAGQKVIESGSERAQTGTETPLLHQSHREVGAFSGPSSSSQKARSSYVSVSSGTPEKVQGSPTMSVNQNTSTPSPHTYSKKRLLEEVDGTETLPKRTKQV